MSKAFAKAFYNSKKWKNCRDSYISERRLIDGGLCENCHMNPGEELHHKKFLTPDNIHDANVTLNPDNLAWLCKDCHFHEHEKAILIGLQKARKHTKILNENGFYFDENGELKPQKVYIVYGSPASGKTTYVCKNKMQGDMIVDLDLIQQAISLNNKADTPINLLNTSLDIREHIYSLIENKKIDCKNIWVVASLPRKKERSELAARLDAELIFMYATKSECFKRADADGERKDKYIQHAIITKWFEDYEQ